MKQTWMTSSVSELRTKQSKMSTPRAVLGAFALSALLIAGSMVGLGWADEPARLGSALQLAQADATEIAFWTSVRDSDDPAELQAYLDAYPNGHYAVLARIRLKNLTEGSSPPGAPTASAEPVEGGGLDPATMAGFAFEHAVKLLNEEQIDAALPFLEIAVSRDPNAALYREVLAGAYLSVGGEVAAVFAIEEYQKTLEIDPGRRQALEGLKLAALIADDPLLALEVTEALFTWDGGYDLDQLTDLAAFAIVVDSPDRAIGLLEQALEESGREPVVDAAVKLNLAALYEYKGELPRARTLTEEVLREVDSGSQVADLAQSLIDRWSAQ